MCLKQTANYFVLIFGTFFYNNTTSVSEMTYTVSSGTLNSSIPFHTIQQYHEITLFVTVLSIITFQGDIRTSV